MTEKKSPYFKIGSAVDDVKYAFGAKETTLATLKLFGKSAFNIGRFAVAEVIPSAVKHSADAILKNEKASPEQRERATEAKEKAKQMQSNFRGDDSH